MSIFLPRTWADISVDNIEHNYNVIKNSVDDNVKMMAIVKADAYGHGVKYIAPMLQSLGAEWFAVSNIEEALQLRSLGIIRPILILGYTPPFMAKVLSENNISQTVFDLDYATALSQNAVENNVFVKCHIKIDTGMCRIGFLHHSVDDNTAFKQLIEVSKLKSLVMEGVFTHFASADLDGDKNGEFTRHQYMLFCDIINKLENVKIKFELRHCCNSGAIINYPEMHLDMVRPGIILYGMQPSSDYQRKLDLKPAMRLKSVISMIKYIENGDCVSYGRTFVANCRMKIATIPIGYADGYPRSLSNKGFVMINKKRANIIGRVCMDQMVVDVTDIDDVKIGQSVLLFGEDENGSNPVEEFSALCDTVNYETVCIVGKRVPRVYYHNQKEIGYLNYVYNSEDKTN